MNQIIGLTIYVYIPYMIWVLITILFYNRIKSPTVYSFIIHCLYIASILFIGFHKHEESSIRSLAVLSTVLGVALYLYFIRSRKTLLKTVITPLPYLIFYTTYLLASAW
ncbi:hypothetical protein [Thermosphaera sp.]